MSGQSGQTGAKPSVRDMMDRYLEQYPRAASPVRPQANTGVPPSVPYEEIFHKLQTLNHESLQQDHPDSAVPKQEELNKFTTRAKDFLIMYEAGFPDKVISYELGAGLGAVVWVCKNCMDIYKDFKKWREGRLALGDYDFSAFY